MSCGIYKIENKINGKIYIGQSIEIEHRWQKHLAANDDFVIHKALKKYGKENFDFSIIEECNSLELDNKEKYWIDYYNSLIPNGYNMIPGGSQGLGLAKGKPVQQYDLKGNFIAEYPSAHQASSATGINFSSICACCRNEISHTKEFQWKCTNDKNKIINIINNHEAIIVERKVYQYNLDGKLIKIYNNLNEASINSGISKSIICKVCRFQGNTAGGYVWRYEGNNFSDHKTKPKNRVVEQYDLNGNYLQTFNSITEAAKKTNSNCGNIQSVCAGKKKTSNGYIWKYKI